MIDYLSCTAKNVPYFISGLFDLVTLKVRHKLALCFSVQFIL